MTTQPKKSWLSFIIDLITPFLKTLEYHEIQQLKDHIDNNTTDLKADHPCPPGYIWNGTACVPDIG